MPSPAPNRQMAGHSPSPCRSYSPAPRSNHSSNSGYIGDESGYTSDTASNNTGPAHARGRARTRPLGADGPSPDAALAYGRPGSQNRDSLFNRGLNAMTSAFASRSSSNTSGLAYPPPNRRTPSSAGSQLSHDSEDLQTRTFEVGDDGARHQFQVSIRRTSQYYRHARRRSTSSNSLNSHSPRNGSPHRMNTLPSNSVSIAGAAIIMGNQPGGVHNVLTWIGDQTFPLPNNQASN